MNTEGPSQELVNALELLGHAFAAKVTDGFGVTDTPVSSLIQAVAGGGRNKGFAEHMALKLEAGMSITSRRPTRSSGMPGQWLVVTPEIMAAELLRYSDWEFDDCGSILSYFPGADRGEAKVEYLGFARMRETISLPLAELFEFFPQLQPKPVERPKPRASYLASWKPKLKTTMTPSRRARIRRMRSQGFKVETLAKLFKVSTAEINEAARE